MLGITKTIINFVICSKIANAKLGYIKRTTADRLLDGFLKRVGEVNQSDDYALWIDKVYVFGSYLTDVKILGDIDLAILCNQKDNYEEISKKNQAEREHSSYLRYLFYPKIKVILFLRNRSGFISIHDGCDYEYFIVNDKVPNKLLFDRQSI